MKPRQQGDLGELSAIEWLGHQGYGVYVPLFHSPDVDVIATTETDVLQVQVKTCTHFRKGRWHVALCTRGGNQSWSGIVKRFSADRCDRVFVLAGDGRRWFIPSSEIEGGNGVLLGGPKYAAYEIDSGRPIAPPEPRNRYPAQPLAG